MLTVIFTLALAIVYAGGTDSLLKSYKQAESDTQRIRLLFQMGNRFIDGPSDSLIHYYDRALDMIVSGLDSPDANDALLTKYRKLHFRALMELGIENSFQGKNDTALDFYRRAQEVSKMLADSGLMSECYGSMGILHKSRGEYLMAQDYYEKALVMARAAGDPNWEAACYINAGNVLRRTGDFVKALEYYLRALEYFEQAGEDRRIAVSYINIGDLYDEQGDLQEATGYYRKALDLSTASGDNLMIMKGYLNMGMVFLEQDHTETSRTWFIKFAELAEQTGYTQDLDDCYRLIGITYRKESRPETARLYFEKALAMAEREQDRISKSTTLLNLAENYLLTGDNNKALQTAEKGLEIAIQAGEVNMAAEAFELTVKILEKLNRHREALELYRKFTMVKDSIFNAEKYRALAEMQTRYETGKKEQQLLLLNEETRIQQLKLSKRNRMLIISGIITALIIVIAYLLLRQNRLRARHQAVELEHRLLRLQMDPHFIFNALIAIQSFIYKKDPVQAGDYLSKFAALIRMTLENSKNEFVPLEQEIGLIDAYAELQALRFDQKFSHMIEVDEAIDPETLMVPPMLSQPFIENAIEHGLRHKKGQGIVRIGFRPENGYLHCTVEDNGVGREKAKILGKSRSHRSMAISITRERLEIFAKKFRRRFMLKVTDRKDDEGNPAGTTVEITMPYVMKKVYKD